MSLGCVGYYGAQLSASRQRLETVSDISFVLHARSCTSLSTFAATATQQGRKIASAPLTFRTLIKLSRRYQFDGQNLVSRAARAPSSHELRHFTTSLKFPAVDPRRSFNSKQTTTRPSTDIICFTNFSGPITSIAAIFTSADVYTARFSSTCISYREKMISARPAYYTTRVWLHMQKKLLTSTPLRIRRLRIWNRLPQDAYR